MRTIISSVLFFVTVYSLCTAEKTKQWALVISTADSWIMYAGEACMCHAFQTLKKHGIPEERTVVMLTKELAYDKRNPTPGIIINRPNGPDVYHGVHMDYSGEDVVTPDNFLKALSGDDEGLRRKGLNGKVIKSGPNDHIFVFYIGHGGPGVLYFAESVLHASTLHSTIMKMHEEKKYGKMVFYVESCFSGSMFEKKLLPKNINVFATTAANPHESSYACFWDKWRQAYIGSVYSNHWMDNSDQADLTTETLQTQYLIVKNETNTSHVMEYGNLKMGKLVVAEFQGWNKSSAVSNNNIHPQEPVLDLVPFEDVPLATLFHEAEDAKTAKEKKIYLHKIKLIKQFRADVVKLMTRIANISVGHESYKVNAMLTLQRDLTRHVCYVPAVDTLQRVCPGLLKDAFALRQLYVLVNLCEEPLPIRRITKAVESASLAFHICTKNKIVNAS